MIKSKEIINYLDKVFNGDKIYLSNFRGWDFEQILKYGEFKSEDVILDTGALQSYFSIFLALLIRTVITTDNMSWVKRAYYKQSKLTSPEEWMRQVEMKSQGKVKAEIADVCNLQYNDNSFDKVLSISTIEHIDGDFKAMSEMIRVLKPNGLLLLTTEYNSERTKEYSEIDDSYMRIYNKEKIDKLCSGLNIEVRKMNDLGQIHMDIPFITLFLKIRK